MMHLSAHRLVLLIQSLITLSSAREPPRDGFNHFKTEPAFLSNRVRVVETPDDRSLLQPGYIFLAPFPIWPNPLIGPQIIDQDGVSTRSVQNLGRRGADNEKQQLVWYGNDSTTARTQNLHACDYLGGNGDHLCFSQATYTALDHVKGENFVLDNRYMPVRRGFRESAPLRFPNPHEFHTLPGGSSFLTVVYALKNVDLRPYFGPEDGYVEDGCFQEVDFATGEATFTWCALDHIELWHTEIFLDTPENTVNVTDEHYGSGTAKLPWDYFHINSVDKDEAGDYVISARHLSTAFKIAGLHSPSEKPPGSILWRLGGKFNDFNNTSLLDLSRQHHVRQMSKKGSEVKFSLFNNQWEVHTDGGRLISNGQVVTIDEDTMSVTHVKKYYHPEALRSLAQGSMQTLANGNAFVGWGSIAHASEFGADGKILYHVHFAAYNDSGDIDGSIQNYRTYKQDWIGKPTWKPKLVAYSRTCASGEDSPFLAYVSWNGATEVRHWRFYTSRWSRNGPWRAAGNFDKDRFETKVNLRSTGNGNFLSPPRFVKAEALSAHHHILESVVSETYVPATGIADKCDADGCFEPVDFEYDSAASIGGQCKAAPSTHTFWMLLLVIILVEAVDLLFLRAFWMSWVSETVSEKKKIIFGPKSPGYLE